jgi:hypothetical protein
VEIVERSEGGMDLTGVSWNPVFAWLRRLAELKAAGRVD